MGEVFLAWLMILFSEYVEHWGDDEDEGAEDEEPDQPGVGSNDGQVVRDLLHI